MLTNILKLGLNFGKFRYHKYGPQVRKCDPTIRGLRLLSPRFLLMKEPEWKWLAIAIGAGGGEIVVGWRKREETFNFKAALLLWWHRSDGRHWHCFQGLFFFFQHILGTNRPLNFRVPPFRYLLTQAYEDLGFSSWATNSLVIFSFVHVQQRAALGPR